MDRPSLWNWSKAALGLRHVRNALQTLVMTHVNKFYNDLQCSRPTRTCQCNQETILAGKNPTSSNVCPTCLNIYQRLIAETIKGSPTIRNCKVEHWTNNEWEVAKAFIPAGGYKDIDSAGATDVSGLISICLNAKFLREQLFQHDIDAFDEVRKIRNRIFHSITLEIFDTDLEDNVQAMLRILDQRLATNDDIRKDFQTAKEELRKLPDKPLCEHCLEQIDCNKEALENLNIDAMQLLEHLEQQQSGADTLETQKKLAVIIDRQNVHSTRISSQEEKMDQTINTLSSLHSYQERTVKIRDQITDSLMKQGNKMESTLQEALKHNVKIYQAKPVLKKLSDKIDLRLLLVGGTGHGKSETGNSLLGYKAFFSRTSAKSVTKECDWKTSLKDGTTMEIVDTPGLIEHLVDGADIRRELYKALIFSSPGFHAVALVIKPDRFTSEMKQIIDVFFDFFGVGVGKYAFVIFTYTDTQSELMEFLNIHDDDWEQPSDTNPDDCIVGDKLKAALTKNGFKMDQILKKLIDKCGGNIVCINNKQPNKEKQQQQVNAIINQVNTIKSRVGHSYFCNAKFLSFDRIVKIENEKAAQAKEQGIEHAPWFWVRSANSKDVLEKVLREAMDKEREDAERK